MSATRLISMTALALLAFAANSLLCRAALADGSIDAASFTSIRLIAGAAVLWLIVRIRAGSAASKGNWLSALALFAYAAGFSFAYLKLSTATGALLLFGAVQSTMIGYGLYRGERLRGPQLGGLLLAIGGLVGLLLPGISAPPPLASALMLGAGVAWGIYSLRGKGAGDPLQVTAGNFLRTVPIALILSAATLGDISLQNAAGIGYAIASGALASGLGYAVWYSALPALKASTAASVQLSVPVIAALGGVVLLAEPLSLRLLLASLSILGGIALVILTGAASPANQPVARRMG
jgi:drug/metabolite transporter (DMT)-like permease